MRFGIRLLTIVAFTLLLSSPKLVRNGSADGGAEHQGRNLNFGVSGGNVNDATKRFCCSGTLGALVRDTDNTLYILSNNHVLGLSGQANPGDDVSQPGLIDNNCQIPPIVADFTVAPQLGPSNVDAAIAQLRSGAMDASGEIEDIGVPSSVVASPAVGLSVAKSGRTTGFTTGTISSINATVNVQYQRGCGQGKKFVVSFTNQVVIGPGAFSAGGDSGSLIVTNDSNHQPVALLYAGSSTTTIGNPAGEVLTRLSAALGRTVSFVGTTQASSMTTLASNSPLAQDVASANEAKMRCEGDFMSRPGVIGVGVGGAEDGSGDSSIVVYFDRTSGRAHALPKRVDNVKVRVVHTDPFIAF
jgi:Peptidase family S64